MKNQKSKFTEIRIGICSCTHEPRGLNGLEGYQRGENYRYVKVADKENPAKAHYRVFPSSLEPEYYETCGPIIFDKFFKEY